ncbi:thiamine kinase [Alteromonadaceae bacterium Bs31]|nr:thiamine kinase [Alteromonadaceae bacterium Bs31]
MKISYASASEPRLDAALESWKKWPVECKHKPQLIRSLSNGSTNKSFLIRCGQYEYCLRINAANESALGINRALERRVLKTLEPLAIAPKILYHSSHLKYTLLTYISGQAWTRNDCSRLGQRDRLFKLIDKFQRLELEVEPMDYGKYLLNYVKCLETMGKPLAGKTLEEFNKFWEVSSHSLQKGWQPVLCHHDLIPENIVETEQGLKILDWEYAGLGHPEFDKRYTYQCICGSSEEALVSLKSGTFIDQLIYWLVLLWRRVNTLK